MEPSPRLTRWVHAHFDAHLVPDVLQELRALEVVSPSGQPTERIQAAVVFSYHGNWDWFLYALATARLDWRDALVAGELANEGWPQKLDTILGPETAETFCGHRQNDS